MNEELTLEQYRANLRLKSIASLYWFNKNILRYRLLDDKVHKELCDAVQFSKKDMLILMPRDHFKTTCITVGYTLWRIMQDYDIKVLINHKILQKSKDILNAIKTQLEQNKLLISVMGCQVTRDWGNRAITIRGRKKISVEPTVSVGALGHEVTGGHYNLIIDDDLAGLKDMFSEAERENTLNYLKSIPYLRDKSECREIVIGTRWHEQDIYKYISDKRKYVDQYIKDAEEKEGVPLFPKRFSWEDLKKLEEEDPVMYMAQMRNNPRPLKDQLFPLDKLRFFQYNSIKNEYCIGFIDPAFGRRERGEPCYFSFVIANIIDEDAYIMEWYSNKATPEENERLIINSIKEYNIRQLGIESNAAQSIWCRDIEKLVEDNELFCDILPINHTTNKDRRIQGMHGVVTSRTLFRKDWDKAYSESMNQLILYPQAKYKDAPDALEGVLSMMNNVKNVMVSFA